MSRARKASRRRRAERIEQKRRWTAVDAGEVLSAWKASGQTMAAFCHERGLIPERLGRWRRRLREGSRRPAAEQKASRPLAAAGLVELPAARLVEAVITDAGQSPAAVVVELRGGERIAVADPSRVAPKWLLEIASGLARS